MTKKSHDYNFKNLFLDFPKGALEWFFPRPYKILGRYAKSSLFARNLKRTNYLIRDLPWHADSVLFWTSKAAFVAGRIPGRQGKVFNLQVAAVYNRPDGVPSECACNPCGFIYWKNKMAQRCHAQTGNKIKKSVVSSFRIFVLQIIWFNCPWLL